MEYIEHLPTETAVIILRMLRRYGRPPIGFRDCIQDDPTDDLKLMACREVRDYLAYWDDPSAVNRPWIDPGDDG